MAIFVPQFPTPAYIGNIFSCVAIIVDAFSPTNYTPANSNLCGHLSGINSTLGTIIAAQSNISDTTVNVNSFIPQYYAPATTTLGSFLQAIDVSFGSIDTFAPQTFNKQLLLDGDNGTFTANVTGMTATPTATPSQDNIVWHGITGSSLKVVSSFTGPKTISHSNAISVKLGKGYEFSCYVYTPVGTSPTGTVLSIGTTGTGSVRVVNTLTIGASIEGSWQKISARYYPDADQDINVNITSNDWADTTWLNFGNFVVAVDPTISGTQLSPHYFSVRSNVADAFDRIADNFVSEGGTITTSPANLVVTVDKSVYWMDGQVNYSNSIGLAAIASRDNYLFYDSYNDRYVIKDVALAAPQPPTNEGELILWKMVTDVTGVTSVVDIRNLSPFGTIFLADRSVTTIKIALGAVTDAEMNTTGVTPGTYPFSNVTVSAQGRITSISSDAVVTTPKEKNILQYDSGTSKWINTDNLTLQADASTLVDNSFLNSPDILLAGLYDSDPGVGITPTAIPASVQLVVTSTVPEYRMAFSLASEKMSLNQAGYLGIGTITPNNFLQVVGLINFDNATVNTSLGYLAGNVSGFSGNVYVGHSAGMSHTAGNSVMVGYRAGESSVIGTANTFVGKSAGQMNIEGNQNAFFGETAGFNNFSDNNSFFGFQAGQFNTTGNLNSYFGYNSGGSAGLTNATAIGANSSVTANGNLILGAVGVSVGIGVTAVTNTSVLLELASTTGALLVPRMNTAEEMALTPLDGMIIYNNQTNKFRGYENGGWVNLV